MGIAHKAVLVADSNKVQREMMVQALRAKGFIVFRAMSPQEVDFVMEAHPTICVMVCGFEPAELLGLVEMRDGASFEDAYANWRQHHPRLREFILWSDDAAVSRRADACSVSCFPKTPEQRGTDDQPLVSDEVGNGGAEKSRKKRKPAPPVFKHQNKLNMEVVTQVVVSALLR